MRALLLVCVGLVRVGAFASLPDSEQIESRTAGSTHVKVRSNAYCGNRVCAGESCAQSRTTLDAAACAAAVMKDPKCGNSFSFGENSDPKLQYCDCAPVGAPCVATPFAFYDVYELVFDKTEKLSCGAVIDVSSYYVDPSTNAITPLTLCGASQYRR